jgi:hypothetical protein
MESVPQRAKTFRMSNSIHPYGSKMYKLFANKS